MVEGLQAQAATLTIAQAFNLAYECWQASQNQRTNRHTRKREASRGRREASGNRRESSGNRREPSRNRKEPGGHFRDSSRNRIEAKDNQEEVSGNAGSKQETMDARPYSNMVTTRAIVERRGGEGEGGREDKTTSPSSGYNSCSSGQEEETFLIDLSSPGDGLQQLPATGTGKPDWQAAPAAGKQGWQPPAAGKQEQPAAPAGKENWVMFEDPPEVVPAGGGEAGGHGILADLDLGFKK